VPVAFVGHPVLDALARRRRAPRRARSSVSTVDAPVVGLLPGSRRHEVSGVLPTMREAAALVAAAHPDARFLVGAGPHGRRGDLSADGGPPLRVVIGPHYTVMRAADLLLVTSGTATLEAALLGTPMVRVLPISRLTELLFKPLVRVPWISLANVALGRAVVPELYQRALTGEALAARRCACSIRRPRWPDSARRSASWRASSARRASARAPRVTCSTWPLDARGAHEHAARADAAGGGRLGRERARRDALGARRPAWTRCGPSGRRAGR